MGQKALELKMAYSWVILHILLAWGSLVAAVETGFTSYARALEYGPQNIHSYDHSFHPIPAQDPHAPRATNPPEQESTSASTNPVLLDKTWVASGQSEITSDLAQEPGEDEAWLDLQIFQRIFNSGPSAPDLHYAYCPRDQRLKELLADFDQQLLVALSAYNNTLLSKTEHAYAPDERSTWYFDRNSQNLVPPEFDMQDSWHQSTTHERGLELEAYSEHMGVEALFTLSGNLELTESIQPPQNTTAIGEPYNVSSILATGVDAPSYADVAMPSFTPIKPLQLDFLYSAAPNSTDDQHEGATCQNLGPFPEPSKTSPLWVHQTQPLFYLSSNASKAEIDVYCARLKHEGYQAILCQFCSGNQGRISNLKRHLYFRFGIKPYACEGGCGKMFSTEDNAKRHREKTKCDEKSRQRQPDFTLGHVPRCKVSTRPKKARKA